MVATGSLATPRRNQCFRSIFSNLLRQWPRRLSLACRNCASRRQLRANRLALIPAKTSLSESTSVRGLVRAAFPVLPTGQGLHSRPADRLAKQERVDVLQIDNAAVRDKQIELLRKVCIASAV